MGSGRWSTNVYDEYNRMKAASGKSVFDYSDSMHRMKRSDWHVHATLDPKNIKALALSASASFQEKNYAGAVGQWKKILVLVPPDSDIARSTMSSIGEAQNLVEQAGKPDLPPSHSRVIHNQSFSCNLLDGN